MTGRNLSMSVGMRPSLHLALILGFGWCLVEAVAFAPPARRFPPLPSSMAKDGCGVWHAGRVPPVGGRPMLGAGVGLGEGARRMNGGGHLGGRCVMMAGKGFGAPKRRLNLEYGGSSGMDPQQQQKNWETQYQAFIKRMGKYLTAMSWEGHLRHGRGAIYANNQARPPVQRGEEVKRDPKNKFGAPTMYVPKAKYGERKPKSPEEQANLDEILKRIDAYDAEREFVVIFEAAGLMGADIVKPSVSPPEMHKIINPSEYGMPEGGEVEDTRALAEYWTSGAAAKPSDGDDIIDMSAFIAEAQNRDDGLMDVDMGDLADGDSKPRPLEP